VAEEETKTERAWGGGSAKKKKGQNTFGRGTRTKKKKALGLLGGRWPSAAKRTEGSWDEALHGGIKAEPLIEELEKKKLEQDQELSPRSE